MAILVTLGIRSNMAALLAGLSATLLAGIAQVYLPTQFGLVTPILFGLGAVQVAKFPNGMMTENARRVLWAWGKVVKLRPVGPQADTVRRPVEPSGVSLSALSKVRRTVVSAIVGTTSKSIEGGP